MRRTERFRSSGGRQRIAAGALIAALTAVAPALADDYTDGITAFEAQDYDAAAASWRRAAQDGSADASMALGLLADLGLGMPRQPEVAFGYYRTAAELGVPAAAFNVGVMLDSGNGTPRDSIAASIWYARAALSGNIRAAYNLGLMYRDGSGVPMNHDLAGYWLGIAAATLPAAVEAAQRLKGATIRELEAPLPLSGDTVGRDGVLLADLVWTSGPGPRLSAFAVQVVDAPTDTARTPGYATYETIGSARQVKVAASGFRWRVARIDPETGRYAASAWKGGGQEPVVTGPRGIVSILVPEDDRGAAEVAKNLVRALERSGMIVRVTPVSDDLPETGLRYRYETDADLARDLAAFLPGFTPEAAVLSKDLAAGPGEVVVTLVRDRDVAVTP